MNIGIMGDKVILDINGEKKITEATPSSLINIKRRWDNDRITLKLPKKLSAVPLPDAPKKVAFMDDPFVLAGLIDKEIKLYGDAGNPTSILEPDNVREWDVWLSGYKTKNQEQNIRFKPLYEIKDETYTVYFPVDEGK